MSHLQTYIQPSYKHDPFHLFSIEHLVTLLIIGGLGVCLFFVSRRLKRPSSGRVIRYLLAFLLLTSQISYHIWRLYYGTWSVRTSLPLELSDLSVYLCAAMLLTRSKKMFSFLIFAGLGSSLQAMLTPNLGIYSFPHFRYLIFFMSHGSVFLSCLFMAFVENWKLTMRSLWITVLIVNVYGVCVYFINRWIGSNYLYLMKKPSESSLLDVLGPWPWYIASAEVVMIISFLIIYWLYHRLKTII